MEQLDVFPIAVHRILENLRAFIIVLARDGTIRYVNDALLKCTQCTQYKYLGLPLCEAPWWLDGSSFQDDIDICFHDALRGRTVELNLDLVACSQPTTMVFEFKPLRNSAGAVVAVLAEGRDVTEQKLLERKLKDAHFRWRTIADCTVDWEFWLHPAGYFIYSSPSCQRITGYGVDDMTQGRVSISSIAHAEDRKVVSELLTGAFSGTTGHSQQFRIVRRDGTVRFVSMSWQPVQGEDGRFLGVRGSVRDVTEINAAEKESLRLLQAYRTLARHFPKGVVALLDSDLRFVVCDGPAFNKTGLDPKRFIGKRFDRVMEPKVLERLTPMLMNAREGHDVEESLEYDGQTWLIHFTPVRGEGGAVRHVIASAVIAEKENEKRLER